MACSAGKPEKGGKMEGKGETWSMTRKNGGRKGGSSLERFDEESQDRAGAGFRVKNLKLNMHFLATKTVRKRGVCNRHETSRKKQQYGSGTT